MAKDQKSSGQKVPNGHILMPALDVIRIVENNCAGIRRDQLVLSLFDLYQRRELDNRTYSRFERLIRNNGTATEKTRLENFLKEK